MHPEGKDIFGKGRSLYLGASKRGRPYSLSRFGLDVLQAGLSFAVGLELQEGPSIFSPDEFAQGCVFIPESANPCLLVAHL